MEFDKALKDCVEAIRLDPNDVNSYVTRGLVLLHMHEFNKAVKDFSEAIRLEPSLFDATEVN